MEVPLSQPQCDLPRGCMVMRRQGESGEEVILAAALSNSARTDLASDMMALEERVSVLCLICHVVKIIRLAGSTQLDITFHH